jgi:hypothetical protein
MTNEKINIKIAEACGWTDISKYTQAIDGWYGYEPENGHHSQVPDYCNDLNKIHEAEKTLKLGLRNTYDAELGLIAKRDHCFIWETTALQRAEAFLRTFGKWEDAK